MRELLQLRPEGLYCPAGDFHIDPTRPVERAIITHGHADHAKAGMGTYITASQGLPLLQWRLPGGNFQGREYGEAFDLGRARVSLHPAGHILGSAQVRIEAGGQCWVVSGDYKRQADPSCMPFEVVPCDTFVTECTFALPVYRWPDTVHVIDEILQWRAGCERRGQAALLYCYALGKAQRILAELSERLASPVLLHDAMCEGVEIYRRAGIHMADTMPFSRLGKGGGRAGSLVLAPPAAARSAWARGLGDHQRGFASGWMRIRGNRRRRNVDRGFIISDHVDWPGLLRTIRETGARHIIAMHGDTRALVRVLEEQGLRAEGLRSMAFSEED